MGLVNFIATKYGDDIIIDILNEKFPPLVTLLDGLDEKSLPVILADFFDACDKLEEQELKLDKKTPKKTINWKSYKRRILTESPFLNVLFDFLKEIGFEQMFNIDVSKLLSELAKHKSS